MRPARKRGPIATPLSLVPTRPAQLQLSFRGRLDTALSLVTDVTKEPSADPGLPIQFGPITQGGTPPPRLALSTVSREAIKDKFARLAEAWRDDTRYTSSASDRTIRNPYYLRIVGMGPAVVPLILQELLSRPDDWFGALALITEAQPVPPEEAGNLKAMTRAWVRWSRENGYYP